MTDSSPSFITTSVANQLPQSPIKSFRDSPRAKVRLAPASSASAQTTNTYAVAAKLPEDDIPGGTFNLIPVDDTSGSFNLIPVDRVNPSNELQVDMVGGGGDVDMVVAGGDVDMVGAGGDDVAPDNLDQHTTEVTHPNILQTKCSLFSPQTEPAFKCDLCDSKFITVSKMERHMTEKHQDNPNLLRCSPECNFPYIAERQWRLKRHRATEACTRFKNQYYIQN